MWLRFVIHGTLWAVGLCYSNPEMCILNGGLVYRLVSSLTVLSDLYLASMNSTANAVIACQLSRLDEAALLSQLSSQLWIYGGNPFRELLGLVSRDQAPTLGALHIV